MSDGKTEAEGARPWRNLYGRRHGKALRPQQEERMARGLAALRLPGVDWDENPERRPLGGLPARVWLEIGFGGGEHLHHLARAHPGVLMLGAEPFVNGIASLCGHWDRERVENLRIHPGDARDLLDVLPEGAVERAFLLYPDPWPKARHHRRRFVTPEPLAQLRRALRPGALFHLATDIEDYVRQALEEVPRAGFVLETGPAGEPWEGWPGTRYERKALREGRRPLYATFRRP
ncbi:tRNA (guanosine(46)-N(7))-methyltransferase TrmB [Rubellimicrobium sp. CFH 75288]|uniref:tRNA (guanine(46)-N(7))-methyltransferase TrmB n=1 Tax=Rubellimicrobium sp. CFH 75288 TaxID=2697034 RepID=UPI001412BB37|nr:tRNA (guanine(46)-N(7))-methyltransferase TrmB [Rubellimicrobium sp. CFH 75288]NAZ36114.1 tRNA (guanosine(46)-N7)-methyltransferase TrmB [Rubellimicrobium sp. CFH 75288]